MSAPRQLNLGEVLSLMEEARVQRDVAEAKALEEARMRAISAGMSSRSARRAAEAERRRAAKRASRALRGGR